MSVSEPGKILTPWAASGLKNVIPPTANPVTGNAGYDQGFPAINMTAKEAGGIPPFGQDFNGIFFDITEILRYMQAGGQPTFSSAMSDAIGGYPNGATLLGDDGDTLYRNTVDGNTTNPNSGGAGWDAGVFNSYPVGAPIPWPTAVPPAGFLAMTGQSFSAVTYPLLALAYPALVLPDMRAEFIRGWDNGRGVDVGRSLLSQQSDAIRNITGSVTPTINDAGSAYIPVHLPVGALRNSSSASVSAISVSGGLVTRTTGISFDASRVVPTAAENRPRNIPFNYIVRAA